MAKCLKCGHEFQGNICDKCGWEYKSISGLRVAADAGDAESQALLGQVYYHGKGVPADLQESIKWHRLAAMNGNADSQFDLGRMYVLGEGMPKDMAEGVKWFMKAAEQINWAAIYNVALAYKYGIGVKQDFGKAVEWFSKGKPNDYAEMYGLGQCYHKGNDDEKKCPNCGKEIEKFDYYCGLTGEHSEWSDLRHAAPQALVPSLVQMCPHCGNLFTMNLEPISIPESRGVNFINHVEFGGLIRGAFRYCSPVSEFKWDNPAQEFNQRMLFLWAYNDYFYRNESEHPEPDEMVRLMHHHNVMELLKFIENPLSQCDYLRMAGDFDKCISRVKAIMPYVVTESVPMLELVKHKAQIKDCAPFKLSELQSDDELPF